MPPPPLDAVLLSIGRYIRVEGQERCTCISNKGDIQFNINLTNRLEFVWNVVFTEFGTHTNEGICIASADTRKGVLGVNTCILIYVHRAL